MLCAFRLLRVSGWVMLPLVVASARGLGSREGSLRRCLPGESPRVQVPRGPGWFRAVWDPLPWRGSGPPPSQPPCPDGDIRDWNGSGDLTMVPARSRVFSAYPECRLCLGPALARSPGTMRAWSSVTRTRGYSQETGRSPPPRTCTCAPLEWGLSCVFGKSHDSHTDTHQACVKYPPVRE